MSTLQIDPLGDKAALVTFKEKQKHHIPKFVESIKEAECLGVIDVLVAFDCVAIYYDPVTLYKHRSQPEEALPFDVLYTWLLKRWKKIQTTRFLEDRSSKVVSIPVCYDLQYGLDLETLSSHTGLSIKEMIDIHAAGEYTVEMIGFSPGFPYLSGLDERLIIPRKAIPRERVPRGSVAIAGKYAGVYPWQTPGGWNVIGRTPLKLFKRDEDPPALLQAGDTVKFYEISHEAFIKGEY